MINLDRKKSDRSSNRVSKTRQIHCVHLAACVAKRQRYEAVINQTSTNAWYS